MWVYFERGFVSVVETRPASQNLVVRGRVLEDVLNFANQVMERRLAAKLILDTPDRDYQHRIILSREQVAGAMTKLVMNLHYDNFKNRVADFDRSRNQVMHRLWSETLALTPGYSRWEGYEDPVIDEPDEEPGPTRRLRGEICPNCDGGGQEPGMLLDMPCTVCHGREVLWNADT